MRVAEELQGDKLCVSVQILTLHGTFSRSTVVHQCSQLVPILENLPTLEIYLWLTLQGKKKSWKVKETNLHRDFFLVTEDGVSM